MSVTFEVNSRILQWVKNQQIPADVIPILNDWIGGKTTPNISTIKNFSKKTNIPFGYFFLDKPPQEEMNIAHCRTINSTKIQNASRDLIDTFNSMVAIKDWMSEYNFQNGFLELPFVGKFSEIDAIESIVADIRQELDLNFNWFSNQKSAIDSFRFLKNKISEIGILILQNGVVGVNNQRKLNVEEFRAFTLIDKYAPLIFINSNDSIKGKIFSLIHEIAHIWIGKENLYNAPYFKADSSSTETICNAVAAEILVPSQLFLVEWKKIDDDIQKKIFQIAEIFKCSMLVVARRAFDFKLISTETYKLIVYQMQQNISDQKTTSDKQNSSGGNFYALLMSRWDKKIISALDASTKTGTLQYLDAYRLTGLKGSTFHKLVKAFNDKAVKKI